MHILVFNAGSSSLKCHLFDWTGVAEHDTPQSSIWQAHVDWSRRSAPASMTVESTLGAKIEEEVAKPEIPGILRRLVETLPAPPDLACHRVVHGGSLFGHATELTREAQSKAMTFNHFAPSHNPIQLEIVGEAEALFGPKVRQFGVFDTAFHSTLQPPEYVLAGPAHWRERGIRRYGFHGISHQNVSRRAAQLLGRDLKDLRLITAHLGNGCSLTAIGGGISLATTMGFTPLDGLVMGTRSGSVDPGVLIHLVRQHGYTAEMLDAELNKESGMKGISGISGDMREVLQAAADGNQDAQLAFDIFTGSVARHAAGLITALGGLDALVFTAGIGENSSEARDAVARKLHFLGIELDAEINQSKPIDQVISKAGASPLVLAVRSEEDWEIARQCFATAG